MSRQSILAIVIAVKITFLFNVSASAFYCYVPEKPGGPIPLRERPNDTAKVVALMPPGGMVRLIPSRRQPEGWVQVRWQRQAQSRKFDARGWARHTEIHGGECED
jgi:hypothetical protein